MAEEWHLTVIKVQSMLVIILNTSLLIFIISKNSLRRKYSNWFLANLFFAHVIEGCVGYLRSSILYSNIKDAYKVSTAVNLFTISTVFSYLTYVPVILDRLFAVKFPFRYQMLKPNPVLSVIGLVWLFTIVFAVLAFTLKMNSRFGDMITISLTIVMFIILISANVLVYRIVRRQAEKIKKTFVQRNSEDVAALSATQNTSLPSSTIISTSTATEEHIHSLHDKKLKKSPGVDFHFLNQMQYRTEIMSSMKYTGVENNSLASHIGNSQETAKEQHSKSKKSRSKGRKKINILDRRCVRSAYICTGIVISFMLCWIPHALHDLLKITNVAPSIIYSDSVLARTTIIIAFSNGIIDPIIYASMNKDIKKELRKLYRHNTVNPMGI
jgi:hypothetical protein